ncbi:hypothetical protein LCGC14_2431680, partial [marine sediment metagenome]
TSVGKFNKREIRRTLDKFLEKAKDMKQP